MPWKDELDAFWIAGLPLLNETVWLDRASGRLIVTDLLFCIGPHESLLARTLARLLGIYQRPGMSRTMKLMVRDRAALARSV